MNEISIKLGDIKRWDKNDICYVDMRGEIAYNHGHLPDAICGIFDKEGNLLETICRIPNKDGNLTEEDLPKDKTLIIYCTYGEKSKPVAARLREKGYTAYSLAGGYGAWLRANVSSMERYERQIILPEVGLSGQQKLRDAKVLIIGAGGLGSPAALYLAGAGVGTIGIVDADEVSLTNLHRQVIHAAGNVGRNKAESAKEGIGRLNDQVAVVTYPYHVTPENISQMIADYDFVLDAVDNFETKFLINDACVIAGKPFCHAGILRFEGQVLTYVPGEGPCYRCIFEEIPERGSIPNCSQAGIIGAVAGIIGCVQALEAIKYILSAGELLTGRMYVLDGLTMTSRIAKFPKSSKACRVCGPNRDIFEVKENCAEYQNRATCELQ